jgi:hypothetical protein
MIDFKENTFYYKGCKITLQTGFTDTFYDCINIYVTKNRTQLMVLHRYRYFPTLLHRVRNLINIMILND